MANRRPTNNKESSEGLSPGVGFIFWLAFTWVAPALVAKGDFKVFLAWFALLQGSVVLVWVVNNQKVNR